MEEWLPDVDSNHGHGDEHTLAIPASSPLLRFSSTRSVWERKTARSAPIAKRKPRIMTARASTPPAETSIVLARTNSGEAQVPLASSVHHSWIGLPTGTESRGSTSGLSGTASGPGQSNSARRFYP